MSGPLDVLALLRLAREGRASAADQSAVIRSLTIESLEAALNDVHQGSVVLTALERATRQGRLSPAWCDYARAHWAGLLDNNNPEESR